MATTASRPRARGEDEDWGSVVDLMIGGDRNAYGKLVRLITGHLAHWRAYDFSADWDDIVQEVILAVVRARGEGKLDAVGSVRAYARQATRFKFIDRIRGNQRRASGVDPESAENSADPCWPPTQPIEEDAIGMRLALERALETLAERERISILEVHLRGRTYEEAAEATGIPLGTLKRALRIGLAQLRAELAKGDEA